MKRNIALTLAIITLMLLVTLSPLPLAHARKGERELQKIIENGFMGYLNAKRFDPTELSEEEASELFLQFLVDKPRYNDLLNEYQILTGQYDSSEETIDVSIEELKEGEVVDTINLWYETIDGVEYAVELTEIKISDDTTVYKATYYSEDGVVEDPYIYVTKKYLYVRVLWWKVKTGELVKLYYKFMKNANGINEASRFIYNVKKLMYSSGLAVAVLVGALAPFTYGLSAIVGGSFYAWQVSMIANELDTAYRNSNDYLKTIMRVNWNYAGIGSWFDIHTIWQDDGSWHMLSLPYLDLLGINSRILADAFKGLGDKYGYNKWVWIGTYYG